MSWNIPVYQPEIDAGIAKAIKTEASVTYASQLKTLKPNDAFLSAFADYTHPKLAVAGDNDQWDLFWMNSILVSVGWNKNDDVFDPGETWAARNSPVNKQFNFMHNEKDIIGHMTASIVLDTDGNPFADDAAVPDTFDIAVASVLYRQWDDDDLQRRMDSLIDEIGEGKWAVSMECLFRNFDYAIISPDGEHKVIARNQDSAHLTQHLRIYGGSGEFEDHKIGRMLRNFAFSGKGLVDNPANERSVIFNGVDPFRSAASKDAFNILDNKTEIKSMSDTNEAVVAQLKDQLAMADARSNKLETKLDSLVVEAQAAEKAKVEGQIAALKVDIEDLTAKFSAKSDELKTSADSLSETSKKLKASDEKIVELEAKVTEVEAVEAKTARISLLVDSNVSLEDASAIVDKWASATDEQFADVVELHKVESKFPPKDDDDDDKRDDKKKDDKKSDAISVDDNDAAADAADLDSAKADDIAASTYGEGDNQMSAKAKSWVASFITSSVKDSE
jgi:hypothetical protein